MPVSQMNRALNNPISHPNRSWRTWTVVTLVVAIVYLLYGTHFGGRVDMPVHPNGIGTYDALAEAILDGHLNLSMNPDDARVQDILFDIAIYQGRYYPYWGIAPAVLLYVPFRAVFDRGLPDAGAAFVFLFGAYLFGSVLLLRIHRRCGNRLGPLSLTCALTVLGLANISLYMIKQARIYEVAASGGIFFFLGGLCLLGHWWLDPENTTTPGSSGNGKLAVASLFFGLCLLSRPSHIFAILALLAMMAAHLVLHTDWNRRLWVRLACLALPVVIGFCLWCAYNWIRFGSPLEAGETLSANGFPKQLFYLQGALRGFYLQILQPPLISFAPPFIRSQGMDAVAKALTFGLPGYALNTFGLIFLVPYTLILPVSLWGAVSALCRPPVESGDVRKPALLFIRWALGISFILTLFLLLCFAVNDLRYPADYLSTAVLLSALAWFSWLEKANAGAAGGGKRPGRVLMIASAMTVTAALSVTIHLIIGFYLS